jgi:hypothetical protein
MEKSRKSSTPPKHFLRQSSAGSAAILQTLGVKYELQRTLPHYELVVGECPLVRFKTVNVKLAL